MFELRLVKDPGNTQNYSPDSQILFPVGNDDILEMIGWMVEFTVLESFWLTASWELYNQEVIGLCSYNMPSIKIKCT